MRHTQPLIAIFEQRTWFQEGEKHSSTTFFTQNITGKELFKLIKPFSNHQVVRTLLVEAAQPAKLFLINQLHDQLVGYQ